MRRLAGPADPPDEGQLRTIADGVRVLALRTPTLPPATQTNCYLIGATDRPGSFVLVDPGSPYRDQQDRLDSLLTSESVAGRCIAAVILTHHHGDHIGGAEHLRKRWAIPIWAHSATATALASRIVVDRNLEPGTLLIDHLATEVYHTPGHAVGHICVAIPTANATVVGDMVAGVGSILIDPDEGDMTDYLDSLHLLESIAPGVLLPAHGPEISDGIAKLRAYRQHRLQREQKIADALASLPGATAEQLLPLAYLDTPRMFWPLALRSTLAHLAKLARDGRATKDEMDQWTLRAA